MIASWRIRRRAGRCRGTLPAGKRREQIENYLFQRIRPALPIIGFEERAAQWQAEQRASLRQTGKSPSYPDSQIAAIAAVNDLVLVTRNIEDFADFLGLRTENWFEQDTIDSSICLFVAPDIRIRSAQTG